jgi:streptomycin 6-kinase
MASDGHPALCHLYIHRMAISPYPENALPAPDRLTMSDASRVWRLSSSGGFYRAMLADDDYSSETTGSKLYTYRTRDMYVKLYSACSPLQGSI